MMVATIFLCAWLACQSSEGRMVASKGWGRTRGMMATAEAIGSVRRYKAHGHKDGKHRFLG